MTKQEYVAYVEEKQKPSPLGKNLLWAFLVGGTICLIGQLMADGLRLLGTDEEQVSTLVSMTWIAIAALLTGIGIFDKIAKRAGAGTLVPITGFANAMVSPAMEFKSEGAITGTAVKLFSVAGPVIVYGICTSVIMGFVQYFFF